MTEALRLARRGRTSPNPHVGAVVVRGTEVVGRGYHARAGAAHAEVMALNQAGKNAKDASLYVTLEPCHHQGRTPPCTEAIVAAGIKRVVYGAKDPMPHRPGGVAYLRRRGIEVVGGVLNEACQAVIADFTKWRTTGLPWVTLKAALTLDGRMATRTGDSKWITGERARKRAHRYRAEHDAILVGIGTVLADDPMLDVRLVRGRNPLRVVLDRRLRTPVTSKLVRSADEIATLIMHGPRTSKVVREALLARGCALTEVATVDGALDMRAALAHLGRLGVVRVLAEGGAGIHGALLAAKLADEGAFFIAPRLLGDPEAMPLAHGPAVARMAEAVSLESPTRTDLSPDWLFSGRLKYAQGLS